MADRLQMKCIFLKEYHRIFIEISFRFVFDLDLIGHKSAQVQLKAWP